MAISNIGGGAYGVKPISQPKIQERSSQSVRSGRFTANVDVRQFDSCLTNISC